MELTNEILIFTTAEDQMNYFYGESHQFDYWFNQAGEMQPGEYRIIDGKLCKIISGLAESEVKTKLRNLDNATDDE